jgi:hypothetical protein
LKSEILGLNHQMSKFVLDVFNIILKFCYPQTARNIFLVNKKLASMRDSHILWRYWLAKFFPDVTYDAETPITKLREMFIKNWTSGDILFLEVYAYDAIYDIDRVVSLTPFIARRFGKDVELLAIISRIPSATSLNFDNSPYLRNGYYKERYLDHINLNNVVPNFALGNSKILLWNEDMRNRAAQQIIIARRALSDRMLCFTVTSHNNLTFAFNSILLKPLYDAKGLEVAFPAMSRIDKLTFKNKQWDKPIIDLPIARTLNFVPYTPRKHECHCNCAHGK